MQSNFAGRYGPVLALALPAIAANITVPLLGLVDSAITGHLGRTDYIGAVSVGATIFNLIYWNLGFLRMGTSGQTSQALGRRNLPQAADCLLRSLGVALFMALVIIAFRWPLARLVFAIAQAPQGVAQAAASYYGICIWGAPAVLGLYSLKGWFIGMQNTRFCMYIALAVNLLNIAASLVFVYVLDLGLRGVALGTLTAEYAGLFTALLLLWSCYGKVARRASLSSAFGRLCLAGFFSLNGTIFLRSLCLSLVTGYFTLAGAAMGAVVLAANTLMLQLFYLLSYFTDGFAYAAEALSGKAVGARDLPRLRRCISSIFAWGAGISGVFLALFAFGAVPFVGLLTNDVAVRQLLPAFYPWLLLIPLVGTAAFLWDGVMVGATRPRPMLWGTLVGAALFFSTFWCLRSSLGNHALWLAFVLYLAARSVVQSLWARRVWWA